MFLQAYTGCITIIISIIRNIIALKKRDKNENIILAIFIILYIVMGIITYNSIFSILPILASIIYVIGIWNGNENIIRKTGLINMYLWLIYSISTFAVAGAIHNIILIISTHIAIRNNRGGSMQGKIISNISNLYYVETEGQIYECNARGKLKLEDIGPTVGDEVIFNKEEKIIEEILPRTTYIKRPKVSNITQMICVISAKNPKPDLLMLDKQLAYAEYIGIKSIIVINKIDLDEKKVNEIKEIYKNVGYRIIETNAKEKEGIEELKNILENNISVFSGNSGVGKSTLLNDIFNEEKTKEGLISDKNKRGKNTTTNISLYKINENEYIADTPRIFYI